MNTGIAQQVYYPSEENVIIASDVRALWKNFAVLNKPMNAYVYQAGQISPKKGKRIRTGDVVAFDEFVRDPSLPLWGGFDCADIANSSSGTMIGDFAFGCKQCSRWCGLDTLADSSMYFSEEAFEAIGYDCGLDLIQKHFDLADKSGALYGCVDASHVSHLFGGMAFGSIVLPKLPMYRWVEQANWVLAARNSPMVRSVYWGNFFGEGLLKRLDAVCSGNFAESFQNYARYSDGEACGLVWRFRKGVFVSLGLNPMECAPGIPLNLSTQKNLIWLVRVVREAGLF